MFNKQIMKLIGMVAVVALAVALYFFAFIQQTGEYSIVYLSTGEVYIGHLSTFPRLKLTEGYIFQVVADPINEGKSTFQLSPLKEALWSPEYLYVNPDHVLFMGPLSETSNIYQTLKNPTNAKNTPPQNNPPTEENAEEKKSD